MIQETCVEIGELEERWVRVREAQNARRNRIRAIDDLIEEFEKLNLAEERDVPVELRGRVLAVIASEHQATPPRISEPLGISEWMDALYDAQDSLMFGSDEGD